MRVFSDFKVNQGILIKSNFWHLFLNMPKIVQRRLPQCQHFSAPRAAIASDNLVPGGAYQRKSAWTEAVEAFVVYGCFQTYKVFGNLIGL
jgi:hypothetical protein